MVDLVLNWITNPELPAQQFTIPMELIKRESCRSTPQIPESASQVRAQIVRPA
jgi:hypothetical protein